jgi:hypothetical protein
VSNSERTLSIRTKEQRLAMAFRASNSYRVPGDGQKGQQASTASAAIHRRCSMRALRHTSGFMLALTGLRSPGHVLLRPWIGRSNVFPLPPALPSRRWTYAYFQGLAGFGSYAQAAQQKRWAAWFGYWEVARASTTTVQATHQYGELERCCDCRTLAPHQHPIAYYSSTHFGSRLLFQQSRP